jgi:hypothetical protein
VNYAQSVALKKDQGFDASHAASANNQFNVAQKMLLRKNGGS